MHLEHVIVVSNQRLHILKALKRQGLSLGLLHCDMNAIIVNNIVSVNVVKLCYTKKIHL